MSPSPIDLAPMGSDLGGALVIAGFFAAVFVAGWLIDRLTQKGGRKK